MTSPKNPRTPPTKLRIFTSDIVTHPVSTPLLRIHTIRGQHPMRWNQFRTHGPLRTMRWDPHPTPVGNHPGYGVAYFSTDATTVFAEVFQSRRTIRATGDKAFTAWFPAHDLRLLDLTKNWATRNGASASLHAAPKSTCRAWAGAIHAQSTEAIHGIIAPSTMTLKPNVILFENADSAFPGAPHFSQPLVHPVVRVVASAAARDLHWPLL